MKRFFYALGLAVLVIFCQACASIDLDGARTAFYRGEPAEAALALSDCNSAGNHSRLLCLMEKGMVFFHQGRYEQSTQVLLAASDLIRELDLISVSEETATTLTGEWIRPYRGEYSERLWVHTYLMMNFLLLDNAQSALVEGKQALEVFNTYPEALADDAFSRALVGLCFENMGLYDDARLEYRRIKDRHGRNLSPGIPRGKGELVVFAAQGRVPVKESRDLFFPPSVRISVPGYAGGTAGSILDFRQNGGTGLAPGFVETDLGKVARSSLGARMDTVLIRQGIRVGAKEGLARLAGNQSETGEILARVVLFLLEQADTRSWQTLPGSLRLYRIPLEPGVHSLELLASGQGRSRTLNRVEILAGKRSYRYVRF